MRGTRFAHLGPTGQKRAHGRLAGEEQRAKGLRECQRGVIADRPIGPDIVSNGRASRRYLTGSSMPLISLSRKSAFEGVKRLAWTRVVLCSTALIPTAVATTIATTTAIAIPPNCLMVGMITSV